MIITMQQMFLNISCFCRISDIQYDIASPQGTGLSAVAVEQCSCGPGYLGLSCEVITYV